MSYGQPCRRITAGPLAGPASAYPILRVPASICFSGANEALVSGGVALPPPGFALLDRASAEPVTISLAAATDIAMAPNSRRRLPLITSDILIELILNLLCSIRSRSCLAGGLQAFCIGTRDGRILSCRG